MDITENLNDALRRELYFELGAAMQFCMNRADPGLEMAIKRIAAIHAALVGPKEILKAA